LAEGDIINQVQRESGRDVKGGMEVEVDGESCRPFAQQRRNSVRHPNHCLSASWLKIKSSSAAVKYGDSLIAIYHIPNRGYYATQQVGVHLCPHQGRYL
jgi:hypothetical protein